MFYCASKNHCSIFRITQKKIQDDGNNKNVYGLKCTKNKKK